MPMLSGFVELGLRIGGILFLPRLWGQTGVWMVDSVGWVGTSLVLCLAAYRAFAGDRKTGSQV